MKVALDTRRLPSATRLKTWRRILCDTFVGIDCRFASEDFRSSIEGHVVGDYGITRVTSTRRRVDRSLTLIKRDGAEVLFFGIMLAGSASIAQGGREAILERGTIVLHDSTRPFRTYLSDASDVIWLTVPKRSLAGACRPVEDMTALAFTPTWPIETIARNMLAGLDEADDLDLATHKTDGLTIHMIEMLAKTIVASAPPLGSGRPIERWH